VAIFAFCPLFLLVRDFSDGFKKVFPTCLPEGQALCLLE
jgi:hypothetical protein